MQQLDRDRLVQLVRRYGNSLSDAILDPFCTLFSIPSIEGVIGYRDERSHAIIFGDPVCDEKDWDKLVEAFQEESIRQKKRIVFVAVSASFARWAMNNGYKALIEFGTELVLDPHNDPKNQKGEDGHVVRRKVKYALKEGLQVKEYVSGDLDLENTLENVCAEWLRARRGPQIHVAHVQLFHDRFGKRWFYAQRGDDIVGVIQLSQLQSRNGWLFSYLMQTPLAPKGTPELLLTSVLEILAQEKCSFVTFGAVTLEELGEMQGLDKISTWIARAVFKGVNRLFHLNARGKFLEKFHPESEPLYLLFLEPHISVGEILALKNAMNVRIL